MGDIAPPATLRRFAKQTPAAAVSQPVDNRIFINHPPARPIDHSGMRRPFPKPLARDRTQKRITHHITSFWS